MSKQILIFIISISFIQKLFSQTKNYKIVYRQCVQMDTLKILGDTIGTEAILIGNNSTSNYSFYKPKKDALKKDTLKKDKQISLEESFAKLIEAKKEGQITKLNISSSTITDTLGNMVFQNKAADSIFVREKMINEYVVTAEKIPVINWDITNDTKIIKTYKCTKAIAHFRGRNYTAWFTTDIPIIAAPWKFNGLPGLVMDIYDSKNQVKIYVESIEYPTSSMVSQFYPHGTKISLNDYFAFRNNELLKKMKSIEMMLNSQEGIDKTSLKPKIHMGSVLYGIEISKD